jgi:ribosomal protein S24E
MNIKKEFRNDLLKRKEFRISREFDSNPGYEKVKQEISDELKIDPGVIFVKKLWNSFGSNNFIIELFVYDSVEDMNNIEVRNKKKKGDKK